MRITNILLCLLVSLSVYSQSGSYQEVLSKFNKDKNFNGVVLVATNGDIDFLGAIGVGNRSENTALTPQSVFQIASLTKVFTAVLIMKLIEEGKLDLDGTIGDYLPNYTGEAKEKVTIHHLLTYSSGIENRLQNLGIKPYQSRRELGAFISEYCSGSLVFEPGSKSAYGNTEYVILQKIVEQVSEQNYEQYLADVILKPLKLKNTGVANFRKLLPVVTTGYMFNDSVNQFFKEDPYYPETYFGSGSLYSNIEDLLKFDQALFNSQLLSESSTKKLLNLHPNLGYTAYGLWGSGGWGTFSEPFYYRTGAILGSNANWIHTMENRKTILVLSNTNATNLYELSEQLYLLSISE